MQPTFMRTCERARRRGAPELLLRGLHLEADDERHLRLVDAEELRHGLALFVLHIDGDEHKLALVAQRLARALERLEHGRVGLEVGGLGNEDHVARDLAVEDAL